RIVQAAITDRSEKTPSTNAPDTSSRLDQLLNYLTRGAEAMMRHWGRPGVNWELTPHFEAVQLLMPELRAKVGPWVARLLEPLRHDGRLLPALKLQEQALKLEETRSASAPQNADYARDLSIS